GNNDENKDARHVEVDRDYIRQLLMNVIRTLIELLQSDHNTGVMSEICDSLISILKSANETKLQDKHDTTINSYNNGNNNNNSNNNGNGNGNGNGSEKQSYTTQYLCLREDLQKLFTTKVINNIMSTLVQCIQQCQKRIATLTRYHAHPSQTYDEIDEEQLHEDQDSEDHLLFQLTVIIGE
ncbi:hypothetical protein RFI_23719, partial [Reticulomyxa filosa]